MINCTKNKLVIIGASGLGKEIAFLAERVGITIKGFLDDKTGCNSFYNYPVLGDISLCKNFIDDQFVVAIANTKVRKEIIQKLITHNIDLGTIIDPSVVYSKKQLKIGNGSVILAGTVCTANVKIGNYTIVNKLCSVGHDVVIGDYVTLSPMCMIGGNVNIESGSEIGAQTSIRQGLVIGKNVKTGMNTTVVKDLYSNSTWVGSPAVELIKAK